jgi:hypothetical protein
MVGCFGEHRKCGRWAGRFMGLLPFCRQTLLWIACQRADGSARARLFETLHLIGGCVGGIIFLVCVAMLFLAEEGLAERRSANIKL